MPGKAAGIEPRAFRKKRNLTLAYASELARPLLAGASSWFSRGEATSAGEWRSGLILSHTHIGDVLYRTCSLEQLSRGLPECRWTYLTSPASAPVLENNPNVVDVLPFVTGENSWDISPDKFRELRELRFDAVLCTNTLRHYPDFMLAVGLGIPNRVGFVEKGMSGLINHPVALEFPQSYPGYFRSVVASITSQSPSWDLRPRTYPSREKRDEANAAWTRAGFQSARPVLACTLSTRQRNGVIPSEVLVAILQAARNEADFDIAFCGSGDERDYLTEIASQLPFESKILAGELSVLAFSHFLSKCRALLTPDSGPRHLGNAAGIPVFFARNLSQLAVETGKYCDSETDLIPGGYELVSRDDVAAVAAKIDIADAGRKIAALLRV